jgi:hypothetical protein
MACEHCGGLTFLSDDMGYVCRACCRSSLTREPTEKERGKRGGGKHIPTDRKTARHMTELARQFAL